MIEVLGCLKATSRCWFGGSEVCWPCAAAAFLCSKQPPDVRRGSKKVRLVETRAAWPFQIEGAAGWCRDRAQVASGAVFPGAAAVAVGPRCPPATALAGLALWLSTSPKLDLMRRMEKKERMRLDEEGRCAARRTREVPQREQFSHGTLETCSSRRAGDQKRAELACAVLIERRSDARIPVISRCVVLEHFLGLREGDGAERLDKQPAAQASLKRFI